jgi:hypothetical protein
MFEHQKIALLMKDKDVHDVNEREERAMVLGDGGWKRSVAWRQLANPHQTMPIFP